MVAKSSSFVKCLSDTLPSFLLWCFIFSLVIGKSYLFMTIELFEDNTVCHLLQIFPQFVVCLSVSLWWFCFMTSACELNA